jgi:hypothetical protein
MTAPHHTAKGAFLMTHHWKLVEEMRNWEAELDAATATF